VSDLIIPLFVVVVTKYVRIQDVYVVRLLKVELTGGE
jgi:hypothetical protein